jgi:glycosyltransferase involved in cell wall biosynthesis
MEQLSFQPENALDLAEKLIAVLQLSSPERDDLGGYLRARTIRMHDLARLTGNLLGVLSAVQH